MSTLTALFEHNVPLPNLILEIMPMPFEFHLKLSIQCTYTCTDFGNFA